ncbi:hypothetical protein CHU98_g7362 [Xylaria longipes]|nr:hypothetical protein CHU98_g7362 [Xylaria longipes]
MSLGSPSYYVVISCQTGAAIDPSPVLPARASPPTILATLAATLTCTIRNSLLLHDFPTLLSPTHNFVPLPPCLRDGCKRTSGIDPTAYRADADCGLAITVSEYVVMTEYDLHIACIYQSSSFERAVPQACSRLHVTLASVRHVDSSVSAQSKDITPATSNRYLAYTKLGGAYFAAQVGDYTAAARDVTEQNCRTIYTTRLPGVERYQGGWAPLTPAAAYYYMLTVETATGGETRRRRGKHSCMALLRNCVSPPPSILPAPARTQRLRQNTVELHGITYSIQSKVVSRMPACILADDGM